MTETNLLDWSGSSRLAFICIMPWIIVGILFVAPYLIAGILGWRWTGLQNEERMLLLGLFAVSTGLIGLAAMLSRE